jgi:hypothetical protein
VQLWAEIVIPLVALAGGWFGNSWRYRRERLDRLAQLQQKSEELELARQRAEREKEGRRESSDRDWIEKAAELCRSGDPQDRQHGRGYLIGLAAMGNDNPRVAELLDQVTQLELGRTVAEIRKAKEHGDSTVDVVEEVVVSDAFDTVEGNESDRGAAGGSVQTQEARQDQDDQGDAATS